MKDTIFTERRSVNEFDSSKKLGRDILKEIIDLAVNAPSAFNLEPWRVIAVGSEEGKERLFNQANQQIKIKQAPYNLIVIGDRNGYGPHNPAWTELAEMMGEDAVKGAMDAAAYLYGSSEERKIKFAESNAGLLAMSIMYAAQAKDVHTHAMSGVDFEGLKKEFSLDENEEVVMVIAVGYRNEEKPLYPRRRRKGYDALVEEV